MAHQEQMFFIEALKTQFPDYFEKKNVAEIGSLNINGSVRSYFNDCDYTGYDVSEGPGVDEVMQGQLVGQASGHYDVTISCECFEHNPYWVETFSNMLRLTRPGGMVVMTCATTGRPEHGTSRSDAESSPLTVGIGWQYYKNLTADDFLDRFNLKGWFEGFHFLVNSQSNDLYFYGIKKGGKIEFPNIIGMVQKMGPIGSQHVAGWIQSQGNILLLRISNGGLRLSVQN